MAGFEDYGLRSGKLVNPDYIPHFLGISEEYPDSGSILLDQKTAILKNLTPDQKQWRDFGFVIKRNFIPHALVDQFLELRRHLNLGEGTFPDCHPHLYSSAIRDMCCSRELHYLLVDLIGEEMGLHFSLNGFKSTERGWHQDDYLNPENTMARYIAIWMAMGDIHPQFGPFEFIPGSHKWPCLRRDKVKALVVPELRDNGTFEWCVAVEYLVNKSVENYMREVGAEAVAFDAKKGDILIWHAKLMHRGSIPHNPELTRPAFITHYSAVRDRRDIGGEITRHRDGGYFWEFSHLGNVLTEDRLSRTDGPVPVAETEIPRLPWSLGRLWGKAGRRQAARAA